MSIDAPELLISFAGLCMMLQLVLSLFARFAVGSDPNALDEIFGHPVLGTPFSRRPYLMKARLFLPWSRAKSLAGHSAIAQLAVWLARLSGTAFLICILGFFASLVYVVGHEA